MRDVANEFKIRFSEITDIQQRYECLVALTKDACPSCAAFWSVIVMLSQLKPNLTSITSDKCLLLAQLKPTMVL